MKRLPRIYLAGKFRGPTNADVQWHIHVAERFQAPIAQAGAFPVCVHVMEGLKMHDVQQADHGKFWLQGTLEEMETCDAVVLVPGWQDSSGTAGEIERAIELALPVFEARWAGHYAPFGMPVPAPIEEWYCNTSPFAVSFAEWLSTALTQGE